MQLQPTTDNQELMQQDLCVEVVLQGLALQHQVCSA
jgi:hypothetical protein